MLSIVDRIKETISEFFFRTKQIGFNKIKMAAKKNIVVKIFENVLL